MTVLAPNEDILVVAVDLPFATRRQREAAAPFAVEGLISQPLDQVHIALGTEISDRRHLCGVVGREVMRRWIETLDRSGLGASVLLPDALLLPTPPEGMWRVAMDGERALVRSGDGAAFAIDAGALAMAWEAAGRPRLLSSGAPLPEVMHAALDAVTFDWGDTDRPVMVIPPLDLRQGEFAAVRRSAVSPGRAAAWIVTAGIVAHLAILGIDTLALHLSANRAEARVRAVLAERAPGQDASDLTAAVDRVAPIGATGEGAFISVLGRASQALASQALASQGLAGGGLAFRSIAYSPGAPLQLAVTAPDARTLDAGVAALTSDGLTAEGRLDPVVEGGAFAAGVNAAIAVSIVGGGQ